MKRHSTFLAIAIAALGLLFLALPSQAQTPTYEPQTLKTFTNGPASGTNINVTLDVRKQSTVALQLKQTSDGTNVSATTGVWIEWSVDGLTYGNGRLITFTPTGTTAATGITNINTFGCGYIHIPYATNSNDVTGITNAVLKYGIKISAP